MILRDYILFQFAILMLLKHFICEFVLQTDEIALSKRKYGSWLSLQHIMHHAFGTLVILQLFHIEIKFIVALLFLEAFIHYHVDWIHMRYGARSYRNKHYWQWLGAEQFLHQLTVILMMIFLIQFTNLVDI